MPAQSRIGDIGIGRCPNHNSPVQYTTVFVNGSPTSDSTNQDDAVVTTIGLCSCGHPTVAVTGSQVVFKDGNAAHRVGDIGMNYGPYTAVTGSPNVEVAQ